MSQATTAAKRTTKKYVPRTSETRGCTKTPGYAHTKDTPGDFYARVTQRKDVRTILEKLAKS